ncbi:hypothetical protein AAEP93_000693 [Penicillium crustosum]
MGFSTALILTLVLPRIALVNPVAQVSSSMGASASTEVEANSKDTALPHDIRCHHFSCTGSREHCPDCCTVKYRDYPRYCCSIEGLVEHNNKEETSVDTASVAKKDTHGATTSANTETSVKPDTSGLNSILPTENSSLRSSASETTSHAS